MTVEPEPSAISEAVLKRLHARFVQYASLRGMGDRAHDVVQETMIVLTTKYASLCTDEHEEDLKRLGFTICRHKLLEELRRRWEHDPVDDDLPLEAGGLRVDEEFDWEARRRRIFAAIATLERRCQHLFRMKLEGLKSAEIAQVMSTRAEPVLPGTVDVWVHRCRRTLFKRLQEHAS